MKNKNNLGGNRNISEKTCSFIYFKSDYDRNKKRTIIRLPVINIVITINKYIISNIILLHNYLY